MVSSKCAWHERSWLTYRERVTNPRVIRINDVPTDRTSAEAASVAVKPYLSYHIKDAYPQ